MILKEEVAVDLATPTGLMRTYMFRPAAEGKYPAVVLFSEISRPLVPSAALPPSSLVMATLSLCLRCITS